MLPIDNIESQRSRIKPGNDEEVMMVQEIRLEARRAGKTTRLIKLYEDDIKALKEVIERNGRDKNAEKLIEEREFMIKRLSRKVA